MTTIVDIAKAAGVSTTLVSRTLNNQKGVSAKTRERILCIAKDLNYRPNMLARSLVLQTTKTIGVVMDNLCVPYYFNFIRGLQEVARAKGYKVLFCGPQDDEQEKSGYIDFFTQGRSDGLVIYGSYLKDLKLIHQLSKTNFPFVVVEYEVTDFPANNVTLDNVYGAKLAVEHLIGLGAKDIRHFAGDVNKSVSIDRLKGFVEVMNAHGMQIGADSIINSTFTEESGYLHMSEMIRKGDIPEAIFFSADITAFGAMRAIMEAGLRIPEDIRIVGFDEDQPESFDILFPPLTTVRQPLHDMGACAIELLIAAIEGKTDEPVKRTMLPELVIKGSCGANLQQTGE